VSRTCLILSLMTVAACKTSDGSKSEPKKPAEASDPWAKKSVDPKSIQDPDLAKMTELAQSGPGREEYPHADAVVAMDHDDIIVKSDYTVVHHHKSIVKLLDAQRGKAKFADVHIPFDAKRQTLTIDTARTVNADGEAHVASPEEIDDIVPPRLADATMYSDVRERVVSFPAVDRDSVVELEWTKTTKLSPDSSLGGEEMLGQWNPVLDRTVTITAPSTMAPTFAVDGMQLEPTKSTSGGNTVWTFHVEKQPDQHPEDDAPPDAAVLPRVVYGFQGSWQKVLEPIAVRFLDKAVPNSLPPSIKEEADRIVLGATTDADKAAKLYAFVAQDIRSIELPLGWAGYEPHAPEAVLANRYADDRDKVGLLLALAASQNIHGNPVLVRTGKVPVIASVPTVAQFDRMIAKLDVGGRDIWLDPSDEYGQYGVAFAGQDNLVLPLHKGGSALASRPSLDPSTSVSHVTTTYTLNAKGDLDAMYKYELSGWYARQASAELRSLKGELLDKFFGRSVSTLSASALDKGHEVGDINSVVNSITVTHRVAVPGYSAAQGNFRSFELPSVTLGVAEDTPTASLSKRKYPLWVGVPRSERGDLTVRIPAGWKVAYVPPKLEGSVDGLAFSSTCAAAGQTVTCHNEVTLDKLVLGTAQYAAFHDAIAKLQAYERRVVLLTKR